MVASRDIYVLVYVFSTDTHTHLWLYAAVVHLMMGANNTRNM
jgi:hypothetical protein